MHASDVVNRLIEGHSDEDIVSEIVCDVEQYLGDVISPETSQEDATEECWTLCIDKANDLIGRGPAAIEAAKKACKALGYPK